MGSKAFQDCLDPAARLKGSAGQVPFDAISNTSGSVIGLFKGPSPQSQQRPCSAELAWAEVAI